MTRSAACDGGHENSATLSRRGSRAAYLPPRLVVSVSLQDWEPSFYWLVAGTAAIVALGAYRPNQNPRDWAADEAAERMRRKEVCRYGAVQHVRRRSRCAVAI
jgi:hypothetical protein